MKSLSSSISGAIVASLVACGAVASTVLSLAVAPFVWVFDVYLEVSPVAALSSTGVNLWRLISGRVLSSQAGRGVAAFVTNLFKVAGRAYLWRAARAA